MAQIKIYGLKPYITENRAALSHIIHGCACSELGLPSDKRFHRFFPMDEADFYFPSDRTARYTIIEVSLFEGRTIETKKAFLRAVMQRLQEEIGLQPADIEITLFETPRCNWGIRGLTGDELQLSYVVDV